MKTTLRAKLLQHLVSKKKGNEGFTLIELLVVIIIIGILAAIALPSFLNQANKARQTEATTNVGAINRGQQAYVLEEAHFADRVSALGIGIKVESKNYIFGDGATANQVKGITGNAIQAFASGDATKYDEGAVVIANPTDGMAKNLKAYVGGTYLLSETTTGEVTSTTILCEKDTAGKAPNANELKDLANLADKGTVVNCADGFTQK